MTLGDEVDDGGQRLPSLLHNSGSAPLLAGDSESTSFNQQLLLEFRNELAVAATVEQRAPRLRRSDEQFAQADS